VSLCDGESHVKGWKEPDHISVSTGPVLSEDISGSQRLVLEEAEFVHEPIKKRSLLKIFQMSVTVPRDLGSELRAGSKILA